MYVCVRLPHSVSACKVQPEASYVRCEHQHVDGGVAVELLLDLEASFARRSPVDSHKSDRGHMLGEEIFLNDVQHDLAMGYIQGFEPRGSILGTPDGTVPGVGMTSTAQRLGIKSTTALAA